MYYMLSLSILDGSLGISVPAYYIYIFDSVHSTYIRLWPGHGD